MPKREEKSVTEQPEKLDLRSFDIVDYKRRELLLLFPEVRTEGGKIDFDRLKLALGEVVDVGRERYGMNWPGKADCFKTIQTPSLGTLLPCRAERVNFDTTENLIVEGDNLEVLKLLQKSYLGKVKVIYIDPPYNGGNDLIYPDDYTESLQTYLEYTGQVDAQGKKFGTNTEADGRFHSKWLNMMYSRLYMARNLLREDGAIFINIDDGEVTNLRRLCDEIFGEENFVATIIWQKVYSPRMDDTGISPDHDYILVYGASSEFIPNRLPFKQNERQFTGCDVETGKRYRPRSLRKEGKNSRRADRPKLWFPVEAPDGTQVYPFKPDGTEGRWRMGRAKYNRLLAKGSIEWVQTDIGWQPYVKQFYNPNATMPYATIWPHSEVGHNHGAADELKALFGDKVFDNPKPVELLKRIIDIGCGSEVANGEDDEDDDIILDFFAGSGTTAQAVLESNNEDGGARKFILVQLPEPLDPLNKDQKSASDFCDSIGKPRNMAEITKERVRRVIKQLKDTDAEETPSLFGKGTPYQDYGFRVFKLAESNLKLWNADVSNDVDVLVRQLELHIDHIRKDRKQEDILYELLLKSGFPLTVSVEELQLAGKRVYSVAEGELFVCLEEKLSLELIRAMAERKPQRVVCLDRGFDDNDQLIANAVQLFKTEGVTSFKTV